MPTLAALILLAGSSLVPSAAGAPGQDGTDLAQVERDLEGRPEDLALLRRASRLAEEAGDADKALWYAWLVAEGSAEQDDAGASADRMRARALDPVRSAHGDWVARWEDIPRRLLETARSCARQGRYRNAADLYLRCRGTSVAAQARQEWEEMLEQDAAAGAVREEGLAWSSASGPAAAASPRSPTAPWAQAYERKTDHYRVRTNLGYPTLLVLCDVLEQMHRHYREVFGVRGRTDRCTVRVYARRAEFEEQEGERARGVRGFYAPEEQVVAVYDPRSEGLGRDALWSTLFHEAAHPFLHEATRGTLPPWLNEGTASYFEGASVLPGGAVRFRGVPEGRLRWLDRILQRGRPDLAQVLSFDRPGSYTADCYPVGWGLVYFLHHYEDERCVRVYQPHYLAYLRSYRREARPDARERFVEYFVRRPAQPGVEDLDQFLGRFRTWMHEYHQDLYGPPERAERWRRQARHQLECGQEEAARDSLLRACERRPDHPATLWDLAQLERRRGDQDQALRILRRLWETLQGVEPEGAVEGMEGTVGDLRRQVQGQIQELQPSLAAFLQEAADEDAVVLRQLATRYYEAGLARASLRLLDRARDLLGPHADLVEMRRIVAAARQVDAGRWRRLAPEEEWSGAGWTFQEGRLQREATAVAPLVLRESMPDRYRLSLELEGDSSLVGGLVLAIAGNTQRRFGLQGASLLWLTVFEEELVGVQHLADLPPGAGPWRLEAEVIDQQCALYLDGRAVGSVVLPGTSHRGGVGVFAGPGAMLHPPEVRY